jgi:adenosylmethionine-8-amino-7-oxononanoate aminotransferase
MKIWRPYTQMQMAGHFPIIDAAKGSFLHLQNGQHCFDGISSWWVITHGHCHPEITEAIKKQSTLLDQVIFANFSHEPAEELIDRLAQFLPQELDVAFFSDNGSTAVEVAMKMAYQAQNQKGSPERRKFLTFAQAYHGDTCGAMSVSGDMVYTQAYLGLQFEVLRAKQGRLLSEPDDVWLSDFKEKLKSHGPELAAVILEPLVQGAGGMIVWPKHVVDEVVRLARAAGLLVIFDEVMTGFGRTGTMFAFEQLNMIPDFICLAKGLTGGTLPMALTITTSSVYDLFLSQDPNRMLFHGHSFTANPIACAAAVANLKIFERESPIQRINKFESIHRQCLEAIPIRANRRTIGTIGVLELTTNKLGYGGTFTREFSENCMKKGLFIRPMGNLIYLMPPYSATPEDLTRSWQIIEDVLRGPGFLL